MITDLTRRLTEAAEKMITAKPTMPFDPFAIAQATSEHALSLAMRPQDLMQVQVAAAQQWGDFWADAWSGKAGERPRDRRFAAPEWQDDAYFRSLRDAYLLASEQLREVVALCDSEILPEIAVLEACDQFDDQLAALNWLSNEPFRKVVISLPEMLEASALV